MREYDVDKTVKKVICNMCGKELKVENGVVVGRKIYLRIPVGIFFGKGRADTSV